MFYKKNVNPCSKFKLANELSTKVRKLMIIYGKNLYYAQQFQKQAYDKSVKPQSSAISNKL